MKEGIYNYLVDVYTCEFLRTGKPFHGMSDEAILILKKSGFVPENIEIEKINTNWKSYRSMVWRLTEKVSHMIPGIERRGFRDHHIDHIVSIWDGFHQGINPMVIADLPNLRMLPYKKNMKKGRKSDFQKRLSLI